MTETDLSELTQFYDVWYINTPRDYPSIGQVYKNPHKPRETWFTIGLGFRNAQIYPKFEPWMRAFATEEQYNEFTKFLEKEFHEPFGEKSKCEDVLCTAVLLLLCLVTVGLCFCLCYLQYEHRKKTNLQEFRSRIVTLFNNEMKRMGIYNVHLTFTNLINEDAKDCWIDSRNVVLDYGPPLGFSIVFTDTEEMQWPPVNVNW